MAEPILSISGLHVFYGESHAIQGVELAVAEPVLSIVGRNGMGKTTLCNTITGLLPARSGSIIFAGEEIVGLDAHLIARRGVGYVPQGRRIWPTLTVDEHLRVAVRAVGNAAWTIERVYETFPQLAERRGHRGSQLSGGEQQMLAIGRALLGNPRLLVMDEPSEGLAPIVVQRIAEILHRLRGSGASILIAEQNMHFCLGIASDAAVIDKGQIVYRDTIAGLKANDEIRARYLAI